MVTLSAAIIKHRIASMRDVEEALARQALYGGDLATNLLEIADVSEAELTRVLALVLGLAPAEKGELARAGETTLRLVPAELAERHVFYPLQEQAGTLTVAVSEPLPQEVEADLGFALGVNVVQRAALVVRVREAIARDYGSPLDVRLERLLAKLDGLLGSLRTTKPRSQDAQSGRQPLEPADASLSAPVNPASRELASPRGEEPQAGVGVAQVPAGRLSRPATDYSELRAAAMSEISEGGQARLPGLNPSDRGSCLVEEASVENPNPAGPPTPRRSALVGRIYSSLEAQQDIVRAKNRDEVLSVCFDFSAQYFEYSALFTVHGEIAEGRDAHGPGRDRSSIAELRIPLDQGNPMSEVRNSGQYRLMRLRNSGGEAQLAHALSRPAGLVTLLMPVMVRTRCVLLFYGDRGKEDTTLAQLSDVLRLAPGVSAALERLILERKSTLQRVRSKPPPLPTRRPSIPAARLRSNIAETTQPTDRVHGTSASKTPSLTSDSASQPGSREPAAPRDEVSERETQPSIAIGAVPSADATADQLAAQHSSGLPVPPVAASSARVREAPARTEAGEAVHGFESAKASTGTGRPSLGTPEERSAEVRSGSVAASKARATAPRAVSDRDNPAAAVGGAVPEASPKRAPPWSSARQETSVAKASTQTVERGMPLQGAAPDPRRLLRHETGPLEYRLLRPGIGLASTDSSQREGKTAVSAVPVLSAGASRSPASSPPPMRKSGVAPAPEPMSDGSVTRALSGSVAQPATTPLGGQPAERDGGADEIRQRRPTPRGGITPLYGSEHVPDTMPPPSSQARLELVLEAPTASDPVTVGEASTARRSPPPSDPPEIAVGSVEVEEDWVVEDGAASPDGKAPLAPAARYVQYGARAPRPGQSISQDTNLPSVIVDVESDCLELLERFIQGDELAEATLLEMGGLAAQVLAERLPGPVVHSNHPGRSLVPSRSGPLLSILVRIGASAVPPVVGKSRAQDPTVRAWATRILGELPWPESARAVVDRLFDEVAEVRRAALSAARMLESDQTSRAQLRQSLEAVCSDAGHPLAARMGAVEALGELCEDRAVPLLVELLGDSEPSLVGAARRILVQLTAQDFGPSRSHYRSWWATHSGSHRIEWLIEALTHENAEIRRHAGEELKRVTKEYFGYYDDLPPKERNAAQSRYREWWNSRGKSLFG